MEPINDTTLNGLSRTLGRMEEQLDNIEKQLSALPTSIVANEVRIRSLEMSRARDRGIKFGIALVLGWLGYETINLPGWLS